MSGAAAIAYGIALMIGRAVNVIPANAPSLPVGWASYACSLRELASYPQSELFIAAALATLAAVIVYFRLASSATSTQTASPTTSAASQAMPSLAVYQSAMSPVASSSTTPPRITSARASTAPPYPSSTPHSQPRVRSTVSPVKKRLKTNASPSTRHRLARSAAPASSPSRLTSQPPIVLYSRIIQLHSYDVDTENHSVPFHWVEDVGGGQSSSEPLSFDVEFVEGDVYSHESDTQARGTTWWVRTTSGWEAADSGFVHPSRQDFTLALLNERPEWVANTSRS